MIEEVALTRPRVDPSVILRLQKHRQRDRIPMMLSETVRKMAALAETLIEPRGWMRREPIRSACSSSCVLVGGGLEFHSKRLACMLRDATEAVLVILTVGPILEQYVQDLIERERLVEGLLLDVAGWVALNASLRDLRQRLRTEAKLRGLRLTGRMAPGFADWPLEEQHLLFSAFAEGGLSEVLTESCMMLPRKSISGLYGLVPVTHL